MNELNLQFLQQPSNGQSFTFTLEFVPPLTQVYTGIFVTGIPFAGEIQIGATLLETIQNTQAYLQLNRPLPGLNYDIVGNNLIITKATRDFELGIFTGIEDVLVIGSEIPIIPKIKINIRSPYKILVDEEDQDGSKIEVFIWNKDQLKPNIPQHILSKRKVSDFQTANEYNISEFAREYVIPLSSAKVTAPAEENVKTWCYLEVVRYKLVGTTYSEIDTLNFICLNGFTSYLDGLNKSTIAQQVLLANSNIKRLQSTDNAHYVNIWLEAGSYRLSRNSVNSDFTVTTEGIWKLPLLSGTNVISVVSGATIATIKAVNECDPIYTPLELSFINRYGGWDFITLFKAKTNSFSSTSTDFNLLPSQSDYDIKEGQKRKFNFNLTQKVKCNTGFVPENYSDLLQDMLVSDVLLLDEKPVTLLTTSFEEKTTLKDNNINYELEFQYNYNLMNDVI